MRKLLALAALVLGLASCQTEPEGLDVNMDGTTTVTVVLPEDAITRAGGTNSSAQSGLINTNGELVRVIFEVYYKGDTNADLRQVQYLEEGTLSTAFDVRLVPNREYTFVAWADMVDATTKTNNYYDVTNLKEVKLEAWTAMDESRDAFTATETVENYTSSSNINLKLVRPFAKLRVVTTDMAQLNDLDIMPTTATVTYTTKHYNTFNAVEGKVVGDSKNRDIKHENYPIASYNEAVTEDADMTLFTDYFFAKEGDVVKFEFNVYDQDNNLIKFNNFNTDIAVNRNYLTTIQGNVLTEGNDVTVKIEDAFANAQNPTDEPYYLEIWDGVTTKQPAYNEATKTYTVKRGSELAWIADAVNGTTRATDAFVGKTIVLAHDIDLGGNEWTPIGMGVKFQGSFDGQGNTIKGLKVTERHGDSQAALFGTIAGTSEFKNVVIDEACIKYPANGKDYYAAAIVGTLYGTHVFENITVKNSTITGNNKVGAIFAHDGSATQITIDNCHVDNCYIASEDTTDGGCVGGLIGYYATGREGKPNTISNSSVKNSTIVGVNSSNNGKRANSEFIGSILTKDAMVLNIVDCVVENNNFSQTIDGVNPVSYVGVFNSKFIGGDREEANKGKVVINGYETVAQGLGVNEEDEYLVTATEGLEYIAEQVNAGNEEFTGADIVLDGDIDLAELAGLTRAAVANNWTPIGTEENPFTGTFNGNGKTIKNLALVESEAKEGKAFVGFFGYAKNATIKNVTFENVYINIPCLDIDHSQGHIGAVAGSLEGTSTIENVTVKGDIKVEATLEANGASRVTVVAGGNSYGNVTMKEVHVIANDGSYLKANNNVGALAGQLQGVSKFENCSSNIDVTGYKFFAGGIIGLAAGDQIFTNCHTTGDVAVVAGREGRHNDEYRVGGIAGGWADGKTKVCTLENCSYTGKVSGKNADGAVAEPLDYAGYVGRGYTLSNCAGSKVIIDDVEYVQLYDNIYGVYTVNGAYAVNSAADLKALANLVNAGTSFEGVEVVLTADIDLKNENWTPIGSITNERGFCGNFDGRNHTIKNLTITNPALDADNYAYAGLFGITENNTIKNLTIENVNISTEGHIVAAAIAYPYYTDVENITVKGNISIKGGDYTSGVLAYTRRCVNAKDIAINANQGSVIEGNSTVGGVISDIQMNGGLKANYSNFEATGLTIKASKCVGGISGIIGAQTLDGATVKNVTIVSDDARKGQVSGSLGEVSVIKNISVENVAGATNVVGATFKDASMIYNVDDIYSGNVKDTYKVGTIVEIDDVKGVIYEIVDGTFKVVSVEQGGEMTWDESMAWAEDLGAGWSLASLVDMQTIYGVRFDLNRALVADDANNVLFEEDNKEEDGTYAAYWTSTLVEGGSTSSPKAYYMYFDAKGRATTSFTMFPVEYSRAVYTLK